MRLPVRLLCVFLGLVLFPTWFAQARTWTDWKGNQIDGKFSRVRGYQVVIKTHRKMIQVPIASLCDNDREYLHVKTLSPDKREKMLAKVRAREERTWSDIDGNQQDGRFYRVIRENVSIYIGGQFDFVVVPFEQLISKDQNHVERWLEKMDLMELLPPRNPRRSEGASAVTPGITTRKRSALRWQKNEGNLLSLSHREELGDVDENTADMVLRDDIVNEDDFYREFGREPRKEDESILPNGQAMKSDDQPVAVINPARAMSENDRFTTEWKQYFVENKGLALLVGVAIVGVAILLKMTRG